MILHWFWDFGVFAIGAGQPSPLVALLPIPFAVIMFIYGIYLLRGYKAPEPAAETAAE